MKSLSLVTKYLSNIMHYIAGIAILSIVGLTVCDVILRRFRMPIDWAYEVIMLLGAIAIGFTLPVASLRKEHVLMEFLVSKTTGSLRKAILSFTRCVGIVLFAMFSARLFSHARHLLASGQSTPTLEIPEYPIAYGLGFCCAIVCLILFQEILELIKGEKS